MIKKLVKIVVLSTALICCMFFILSCSKGNTKATMKVKIDPRVELMSLIFRLAGNPEYNQCRIASYNQDIKKYFSEFKEHDVVKLAIKLRETRGISYDAVMSMAVHVTDAVSLNERIPFKPHPLTLDSRWTPMWAREFLLATSQFVKESKFHEFINAHTSLYNCTKTRMQSFMRKHDVVGWLNEFYGDRPGASFEIILGMLNGPASYGVRIKIPDKEEILYCVLGVYETDEQGNPQFSRWILNTVVHEFCHSYCNLLVEKHASELEASAKKIYHYVKPAMIRMAYSNWQIMIQESLVRASVIRYLLAKFGVKITRDTIEAERKRQFFWIGDLSDLLSEYEENREVYASLDEFFPKFVEFFHNYTKKVDEDMKAFKLTRKRRLEELKSNSPRIISMVPTNGAQDVDPNLKTIVIKFDRPMLNNQWSVMRFNKKFPELGGKVYFNETRKVFYIPVKLKPKTEYELGLNAEGFFGFKSEQGNPLYPVVIRFKTR